VNLFDFIGRNGAEIFQLMLEHLGLVVAAMAIAISAGVPLGIVLTRRPRLQRWILGSANVIQTVPSLALFGFLIPVPLIGGIGNRSAIVALALYALLPILRNTYAGIAAVDPAVVESARAMGMTDRQLLRQVELPMAASVILAGIRVATVISVGIATIAAAVGAGGLGTYIFRGLSMVNNQVILAGAIPAALLALAADWSLGRVEQRMRRYAG
jgi:osmoprotectant transport system permease protein